MLILCTLKTYTKAEITGRKSTTPLSRLKMSENLRKPNNGQMLSFTDEVGDTGLAVDEQVDACFSAACPKRYIIFDHKVGRGTMYMHPELMQRICDFPHEDGLQSNDSAHIRFIDSIESMLQSSESITSSTILRHKSVMVAAFAALEEVRNSRHQQSLINYEGTMHNEPGIPVNSSQLNDTYGNYSGSFSVEHENTADLDALLGSDDESSTAYSPSDITWTNGIVTSPEAQYYCDQRSFNKRTTEAFVIESDGEGEVNSMPR